MVLCCLSTQSMFVGIYIRYESIADQIFNFNQNSLAKRQKNLAFRIDNRPNGARTWHVIHQHSHLYNQTAKYSLGNYKYFILN